MQPDDYLAQEAKARFAQALRGELSAVLFPSATGRGGQSLANFIADAATWDTTTEHALADLLRRGAAGEDVQTACQMLLTAAQNRYVERVRLDYEEALEAAGEDDGGRADAWVQERKEERVHA